MKSYTSTKIRKLSALSILMVIYIHMYYTEGHTMRYLSFVEGFIGGGLCKIAVPLFYIISGYFFFRSMDGGISTIKKKLLKRCRTLLVPYIIANILTFIFYFCLSLIALKVPAIDNVVNFDVISEVKHLGVLGTLKFVFINPPIAFQLWFVRDLMCIMLISPIIYPIINRIPKGKLFPMLLLVIYVFCHDYPLVTALVWFTLGGYISICHFDVEYTAPYWTVFLFISIYISLAFFNSTGFTSVNMSIYIPMAGIPAIWFLYDIFTRKEIAHNNEWEVAKYSFFIYLIHEPLLNIFKKLPLLIERSETSLIIYYLSIPIIFYQLGCLLGKLLSKIFPKAYYIYTGSR